jgi:hypothetical protein
VIYAIPAVVHWIYSFKVWQLSKQLDKIFTQRAIVSNTTLIALFSAGLVVSLI